MSYSSDRVSFTDFTMTGANPLEFSGGRTVGYGATAWDNIYIGTSYVGYPFYGKIGEVKLYYNTAVGPATSLQALNYDLYMPRGFVQNFGKRLYALTMIQNNVTSFRENIAKMTYFPMNYDFQTSLVPTYDQLFKYSQAVDDGQKPKVKVTLTRTSNKDPVSVQGILVNFLRK
jgi:hypothetical protein